MRFETDYIVVNWQKVTQNYDFYTLLQVLQRAAGFFAGHNDNYTVSWADASRSDQKSNFEVNDKKDFFLG